jgi:hypothetical protein
MAEVDELAELMPRTMGGRRLSNVAVDGAGLRAYQEALRASKRAAVRAAAAARRALAACVCARCRAARVALTCSAVCRQAGASSVPEEGEEAGEAGSSVARPVVTLWRRRSGGGAAAGTRTTAKRFAFKCVRARTRGARALPALHARPV